MSKINTIKNKCCVCFSEKSNEVSIGTDFQYKTTDQSFYWHECIDCGHFFLDPFPSVDALSVIYPKNIGNYEQWDKKPGLGFRVKRFLDKRSLRKILKFLPEGKAVLDVGCASGGFLDIVKSEKKNIDTLDGVEISNDAAKGAVEKGYKVFIGPVEEINFQDNKYDLIYLQQVIEHVHDPNKVLSKLSSILNKNGLIVLETPALHSWDHKFFFRRHWEGYHFPRHFNIWTEDGMKKILIANGLELIEKKYRIKPVHWTISFQNWIIDNKSFLWLKNSLNVNHKFPIFLMMFGLIDVLQLLITKKTSDIQYIARKN